MYEYSWPSFPELFTGHSSSSAFAYRDSVVIGVLVVLGLFAFLMTVVERASVRRLRELVLIPRGDSINPREHGFDFFFQVFYLFQTFFLLAISLEPGTHILYPPPTDVAQYWFRIGILMILLLAGFVLVYLVYAWIGYAFLSSAERRHWLMQQLALLSLWGISLYLPVMVMLLSKMPWEWIGLLVALSYLVFRSMVVLVSLRIFVTGFRHSLHLFLYLCACEIGPVIFLANGVTQIT